MLDDEDICIASGRQAHMLRKKCCRYTVKRRYWEPYECRLKGLHLDLIRLGTKNAKKANFKPELLASMHLINALDLQTPGPDPHMTEVIETSFQRLMARFK